VFHSAAAAMETTLASAKNKYQNLGKNSLGWRGSLWQNCAGRERGEEGNKNKKEKVRFLCMEHQHCQGALCSRQTGIWTPTKALGQVSWGLTAPALHHPQERSPREGLWGSYGTPGTLDHPQCVQQLIPALRKEEPCEEEGLALTATTKPQYCHRHRTGVLGWGGPGGKSQ